LFFVNREFPVVIGWALLEDNNLELVVVDWLFTILPLVVLLSPAPSTPASDISDVTDLTEVDLFTKDCVELDSKLDTPLDVLVDLMLLRRTCRTGPGVDVNVDCCLSIFTYYYKLLQ